MRPSQVTTFAVEMMHRWAILAAKEGLLDESVLPVLMHGTDKMKEALYSSIYQSFAFGVLGVSAEESANYMKDSWQTYKDNVFAGDCVWDARRKVLGEAFGEDILEIFKGRLECDCCLEEEESNVS